MEERIERPQETMSLLIGSIDEFRDELVHTLRNLLDPLPPPVHIQQLAGPIRQLRTLGNASMGYPLK